MSVYICKICGRTLNPDEEDIHLTPKDEGEGYDAYCGHCWAEWNLFAGKYGLSVLKEE